MGDYGCQAVFHCYDNALQPSNRLNDANDVQRRKGSVKRVAALPREFPTVCGKSCRHFVVTSDLTQQGRNVRWLH